VDLEAELVESAEVERNSGIIPVQAELISWNRCLLFSGKTLICLERQEDTYLPQVALDMSMRSTRR
jgi:hypothetical protein